MARKAEFVLNGQSYFAEMKKVDRKKIYGWSTTEVYDENGSKCKLAGLAEGKHVLPSGSSALLSVDSHGNYISKKLLVGINEDGFADIASSKVCSREVAFREINTPDFTAAEVLASEVEA